MVYKFRHGAGAFLILNVRFWHLADIDVASENVRFWG